MSYRLEWISGVAVFGTVVVMLIVPEFALIALVVAALAALGALLALITAVLASPCLLVRGLRRRRARPSLRRPRWTHSSSAIPGRQSLRRPTGRLGNAAEGPRR